jgi:hypothetical protein
MKRRSLVGMPFSLSIITRGRTPAAAPFCGSGAFVDEIVGVCTTHAASHRLFDLQPLDPPWTYPENIALGTVGAEIEVGSIFDGWCSMRRPLKMWIRSRFPRHTIRSLRSAFGDLTVHEVAVDPQDESLAYLSYYSGGLIAIQVQCANPDDSSTCELVEVGGYRDPVRAENSIRSCRTLVLMDQATENIPPDHRSRRSVGGVRRGFGNRRVHVERSMGPMTVVVSDKGLKHGLEMATPEDEGAIEARSLAPSERNTSSKPAAYFESRSRIRKRKGKLSHRATRLRAC